MHPTITRHSLAACANAAQMRDAHEESAGDDELAALYVRMWSLASGRRLRPGVRPDQLTEGELIAFWADDMTSRSGRHASTASGRPR